MSKVIQITASEIRIGDRAIPIVFALTDSGEIYRYQPTMHENPEAWVKLVAVVESDDTRKDRDAMTGRPFALPVSGPGR